MQAAKTVRKIPSSLLYVSEPNPRHFGNQPNPASAAHWTNSNWLKSRFHFSFAEYDDNHSNFGVLRVLNDDLVQPQRGFGTHPHRNMEIVTYIVHGNLTHKDSMGTEETLGRGSVQFMTAGTGVYHSEHNLHPTEPLRFLQLWINPRQFNLPPNYGSMVAPSDKSCRHNKWMHIVSDVRNEEKVPIKVNQDVNIHVTELDKDSHVDFTVRLDRQAYFVCVEGNLSLNDENLSQQDAAEISGISGEIPLKVTALNGPATAMIIEMAKTSDSRFVSN